MLYLRSFNRFILISLALLGLSVSSVNAALVQFEYVDTMSFTNIAGLSAGQTAIITVALDNGVAGNISQVWTSSDLQSVTFDFNNGVLLTTFESPWGGSLAGGLGNFSTDATGNLDSVMTSWFDAEVGIDYTSNSSAIPSTWILNGFNSMYRDTSGLVQLTNVSSMLSPTSWSQVSAVPVPAAVWLFGTALIGLIGFDKRKSRIAA
jgi:hypothetical protein